MKNINWKISEGELTVNSNLPKGKQFFINDKTDIACVFAWNENNKDETNIAKEHAEFIVTACNLHNELIEALKEVKDRLDNMTEQGRYSIGLHNIYDTVTTLLSKSK